MAATAIDRRYQGIFSAGAATKSGVHALDYTGRTGALFGLFFRNLLLTLITLGIYRFWAKTRVRRFLWSNTRIDGEAFEYTGTGKELFLGFLKALLILLPLFIGLQVLELVLDDDNHIASGFVAFVRTVLIVTLIYAGSYAARRYRMSRTTWRGIRFQQVGSIWRYAGIAMVGLVLAILTVGLYIPFLQVKLLRYETENLRFGSAGFRFEARGRDLFKRFFIFWIAGIALIPCLAVMAWAFDGSIGGEFQMRVALMLVPLATLAGILVLGIWYQGRYYRFRAENTRFDGLAFGMPHVTGGKVFRLLAGNWLITTLSLGLLTPLATQRVMRFWCRHLEITGGVDLAAIGQAARGPGTGEGLAGFFDIDLS